MCDFKGCYGAKGCTFKSIFLIVILLICWKNRQNSFYCVCSEQEQQWPKGFWEGTEVYKKYLGFENSFGLSFVWIQDHSFWNLTST